MSDYKHRMSLVVPEQLIAKANQLALIVGVSSDDDKTFAQASYQDADGNLYAVCSTAIKPVVLGLFGISLADITLPTHAINADVTAAQQALDKVVMYSDGDKASTASIMCAIDFEPHVFFESLGLMIVADKQLV